MDLANVVNIAASVVALAAAAFALRAKRTDVQSRILQDLEAQYKRTCEERDKYLAELDTEQAARISERSEWERKEKAYLERIAGLEVNGEELRRERIRKERKAADG